MIEWIMSSSSAGPEVCSASDAIALHRENYLSELELEIATISKCFDGLGALTLEYINGWDKSDPC